MLDTFMVNPMLVAPLAVGVGLGLGLVLGASAVALSPAAAGAVNATIAAVTSCATTTACIGATNTASGPAIAGSSAKGTGVSGSSTSGVGVEAVSKSDNALYASNTATRSTIYARQYGSGPALSVTAAAGAGVSATSASGTGVAGTTAATLGSGIAGSAPNGYGVSGTGGFGGYFTGASFDGVLASTATTGYAGVAGADHSPDGGYGVYGASDHGPAGTFFESPGDTQTAFAVYGGTAAGIGSLLMDVRSSDDNGYLDVDDSGNVTISGLLTTGGSCSSGCIASRIRSYAPRETEPTMEDVGSARLSAGNAYVALDPAFANVMDSSAGYAVLLTPEGDSNGLYVTQRNAHGFVVRENRGGHSSLTFSYRIVAKPFGSTAPRLPRIALGARPAHTASLRARLVLANSHAR